MEKTASCVCGQLNVVVTGDPEIVNICSCEACQRRSGSAFQLAAFFSNDKVEAIKGESKIFSRIADSGRKAELHFCPICGVSVYFQAEVFPDMLGVHGGCFADPNFPVPNRAVWVKRKHPWVVLPELESVFEENSVKDGEVDRISRDNTMQPTGEDASD
jgi:hypothetical protein